MTENEILTNKVKFNEIAETITRDGIKDLLEYINNSDFFTAPASTKFHNNFKGGLCKHSLTVYENMVKLRDIYCPDMPDDTVKIVSLFHDLAKIGFYESSVQNKKVYSPSGSKHDELGYFDWVSEMCYKTKDPSLRETICGEHGLNSFIVVNRFIKLSDSESSAIINHHAGMDNGFTFSELGEAFNRYPTLTLLHLADMLTCYINENPYMVE